MTTAQREARAFLSEFHHRPFSVSDLEKALQAQGFSLVEYSRLSNGRDVTTLLTSLQLFDYAAKQSAFTYQDPNLRIVFLQENLSQQEKMILLSHELGHILCRHLEHTSVTGPGAGVLEEQEVNDFSARLLRYNKSCRPRRIAMWAGLGTVVLALVGFLLFGTPSRVNPTVYLTESGRCYHKEDCKFVAGKSNITSISRRQAEDAGYDACTWCFGHNNAP